MLKLVWGSSELNLNDGTNYRLLEWNPAAGDGPVEELLVLEVVAASHDALAAKLATLSQMQRRAALYARDAHGGREPVWLHRQVGDESEVARAVLYEAVERGDRAPEPMLAQFDEPVLGPNEVNVVARVGLTLKRLPWEALTAQVALQNEVVSLLGGRVFLGSEDGSGLVAQVSAGLDDAQLAYDYSIYTFGTTATELRLGAVEELPPDDSYAYYPAWRFQVNVAQGLEVSSAVLRLVATSAGTATEGAVTLRYEDTDNAAVFSTVVDFQARSWSAAGVGYALPASWSAGDVIDIDVTALVNAVVKRTGWASGNYLVLAVRGLVDMFTYLPVAAYEHATYDAGKLVMWGDAVSYGFVAGDLAPRVDKAVISPVEWEDGPGDMTFDVGRVYLGFRAGWRGDLGTFEPLVACEGGTLGEGASVATDPNAYDGQRVGVDFTSEPEWAKRLTVLPDKVGRFLVLVRARGIGADFEGHVYMMHGYDYGPRVASRFVAVEGNVFTLLNFGIVDVPAYWQAPTGATLTHSQFTLDFWARRDSTVGGLALDCVLMLPADYLITMENPAALVDASTMVWQDAAERWAGVLYTGGPATQARGVTVPGAGGSLEPGNMLVCLAGVRHTDDESRLDDLAWVTVRLWPRFRYLRGA